MLPARPAQPLRQNLTASADYPGSPPWLVQTAAALTEAIDAALSVRRAGAPAAELWSAAWCRLLRRLRAAAGVAREGLEVPARNASAVRWVLREVVPSELREHLTRLAEGRVAANLGLAAVSRAAAAVLVDLSAAGWPERLLEHCRQAAGRTEEKEGPSEAAAGTAATSGAGARERGGSLTLFVVVPGVGKRIHLPVLYSNMQWLRGQDLTLACVVYVYRGLEEVNLSEAEVAPCVVVYWQVAQRCGRAGPLEQLLAGAPPPALAGLRLCPCDAGRRGPPGGE